MYLHPFLVDPSLTHFLGEFPGLGLALEISSSAFVVHRRRRKNRETEAKRIEEEAFHDPLPLVLHWDGKLIQSAATSRVSEERIAIVLTGTNFEELPITIDETEREVAVGSFACWKCIRLLTRSSLSPLI